MRNSRIVYEMIAVIIRSHTDLSHGIRLRYQESGEYKEDEKSHFMLFFKLPSSLLQTTLQKRKIIIICYIPVTIYKQLLFVIRRSIHFKKTIEARESS